MSYLDSDPRVLKCAAPVPSPSGPVGHLFHRSLHGTRLAQQRGQSPLGACKVAKQTGPRPLDLCIDDKTV